MVFAPDLNLLICIFSILTKNYVWAQKFFELPSPADIGLIVIAKFTALWLLYFFYNGGVQFKILGGDASIHHLALPDYSLNVLKLLLLFLFLEYSLLFDVFILKQ